jgi:hypothetical protein
MSKNRAAERVLTTPARPDALILCLSTGRDSAPMLPSSGRPARLATPLGTSRSEQLSLLDQPSTDPRCRMCGRPARWLTAHGSFAMYCSGRHCSNRERLCQTCEAPFVLGEGEASNKYCSIPCKLSGYRSSKISTAMSPPCCAWCGKTGPQGTSNNRPRVWPYICRECLRPIRHVVQRLKSHHVPHERAQLLLTRPECEICGTNILHKVRTSANTVAAPMVVDHDHNCCPVDQYSCGRCIRGLICRSCNAAAGQVRDDPNVAQALADYLRSSTAVTS